MVLANRHDPGVHAIAKLPELAAQLEVLQHGFFSPFSSNSFASVMFGPKLLRVPPPPTRPASSRFALAASMSPLRKATRPRIRWLWCEIPSTVELNRGSAFSLGTSVSKFVASV